MLDALIGVSDSLLDSLKSLMERCHMRTRRASGEAYMTNSVPAQRMPKVCEDRDGRSADPGHTALYESPAGQWFRLAVHHEDQANDIS